MDLKDFTAKPGRAAWLAQQLNIPAALISQWTAEKSPRQVPAARCPLIELATLGEVTAEELRPELAWVRVKDRKWPCGRGRPALDFVAAPVVPA